MNYAVFSGRIIENAKIERWNSGDTSGDRLIFKLRAVNMRSKNNPLIVHCEAYLPHLCNEKIMAKLVEGTRVILHGDVFISQWTNNDLVYAGFLLEVKSMDILDRAKAPTSNTKKAGGASQKNMNQLQALYSVDDDSNELLTPDEASKELLQFDEESVDLNNDSDVPY